MMAYHHEDNDDEDQHEQQVMAQLIAARERLGLPARSSPHLTLQQRANTCPLSFPHASSSHSADVHMQPLEESPGYFDLLPALSPPSPPPTRRSRTGSLYPPPPSVQERRSALRASSFNGSSASSASHGGRPVMHARTHQRSASDEVEYVDEEEEEVHDAESVFGASSEAASSSLPTTVPSLCFSRSTNVSLAGDEGEGMAEDGDDERRADILSSMWQDGLHVSSPLPVRSPTSPTASAQAASPRSNKARRLAPSLGPSLTLKLPDLPSAAIAARSDLLAELHRRDSRSKVLAWTQGWREWEWSAEAGLATQDRLQKSIPLPMGRMEQVHGESVPFWAL